ncbi:MAG: ribbon-helix-helix domain-containing protein [Acidimicrobiales bacterium]
MKTAISVPDDTYDRATRRAQELGMSRSEFFSRAAKHYLDELDRESTTAQIDSVLAGLGEDDDSATDAVKVGRGLLANSPDRW